METKISEIRKEYTRGKLTQCTINDNPFEQFEEWLNDAIAHNADEPTAMIVATVSAEGHPSTRTVLLKGVENNKFIFFTNYESRKGKQLAPQSRVISSRMEIMRAFVKEVCKLAGHEIRRPDNWGGFAVTPTRFEFWQGRESRLHDRIQYILQEDGSWKQERLAP